MFISNAWYIGFAAHACATVIKYVRCNLDVSVCKCVFVKCCRQQQQSSLFLSHQVHPDGLWRPPGPVSVRDECGRDLVSLQDATLAAVQELRAAQMLADSRILLWGGHTQRAACTENIHFSIRYWLSTVRGTQGHSGFYLKVSNLDVYLQWGGKHMGWD